MTTREVTQQALAVQDKTVDATSRTKQIVEETIAVLFPPTRSQIMNSQIGTDVNTELKKQGETIDKIQDDVDKIQSDIKKANNQLRIIMRYPLEFDNAN